MDQPEQHGRPAANYTYRWVAAVNSLTRADVVQPVKVNIDSVVLLLCPNNAWTEPAGHGGDDHYEVLVSKTSC